MKLLSYRVVLDFPAIGWHKALKFLLEEFIKGMWSWVNPPTGPGLVLGIYILPMFPRLGATSRTQSGESNVLLRPSDYIHDWTPLRPLYILIILTIRWSDLLILPLPKTSFVHNFLCLLNPPPTSLKVSASFFGLLMSFVCEITFRFHQGNS